MCFDSPDPPKPPDYGPLIAANQKNADYAFALAKEQQDFFKQQYADNKVTQDIITKKALGALDRQEKWAIEDRERYDAMGVPLMEQLAYDAENYASAEEQAYQAGRAEADVAAEFEAARRSAQDRLEGFGVDPSQTRSSALDLGTRIAEAAAQASAGNQTAQAVKDRGMALRQQAIDVFRGMPAQAQAAQAGAGASGTQAVNTGLAGTASAAQTLGTGQGWQGIGNQGLAGWGNALNANFQNQLGAFNAEQSASSGWGDIIGTGLGFATKFLLAEGGAIPDGMPVPEEASPSGGAIPDDVPAELDSGAPARLNAGEFVMPKDVVQWLGEKGMQQMILKARKEMTGANGERPAQPEMGPPPGPGYEGAGAIPAPQGA